MGLFKKLFGGKPCGTGGNEPGKNSEKEPTDMSSLGQLWTYINEECRNNPDHILEISTSIQFSEYTTIRKLHWIKFDGDELNCIRLDHTLNYVSTDNVLTKANMSNELFDAAISNSMRSDRKFTLTWETSWLPTKGMEPRILNRAKKVLAETPACTYGYIVNDWYVNEVGTDDAYISFFDEYGNRIAHRPWVLDAALSHGKVTIDDTKPPYIIYDELNVDHTLLPDCHWRRWVRIEPARRLSMAPLKIVPRGNAKGKVAYYDITFDFDREDLAGVAFSVGNMLKGAIEETFPYEYNGDWQRSYDSTLKPELIQIRFMGFQSSLVEWLESQRDSVTNLEKPYLSPNQPVVEFTGHKFQITSDYYIDFTEWDAANVRN